MVDIACGILFFEVFLQKVDSSILWDLQFLFLNLALIGALLLVQPFLDAIQILGAKREVPLQQVRSTTRCVSLHVTKYTSAKVFYKILLLGRLLKSTIFVVQKAAAPKNGVEFRQKSIFVIRYFLATSYDDVRCRTTLPKSSCSGGWCLKGNMHHKYDLI